MCKGSASFAVDRDRVEGACGGREVLLIGLLTRPRSDRGRSCERVNGHNTSHHNNAPMIHAFLLFPMRSFFHISYLYVSLSFLRLTWLANPALVTSVYPNQMQYTPRVL